jgi:hypothetical protein
MEINPNLKKINRLNIMQKKIVLQNPININASNISNNSYTYLSNLESACFSSNYKIVEQYGSDIKTVLVVSSPPWPNNYQLIAEVLKKVISENDSILFPYTFKGRIHQGYENINNFVSYMVSELKSKNIYLIANEDPDSISSSLNSYYMFVDGIYKDDYVIKEQAASEMIRILQERQNNIFDSKFGILNQLKFSNMVYEINDLTIIAEGTLVNRLKKEGIGYCIIVQEEL